MAAVEPTTAPTHQPQNHKAVLLQPQLLDHATITLEENLYSQAFALLNASLTSGSHNATTVTTPASQIPPPSHLALMATLIVHPNLTTRTNSPDKQAAADDALFYLRAVHANLGASNAGFDRAFRFRGTEALTGRDLRAQGRRRGLSEGLTGEEEKGENDVRSVYADKEAVWARAEDFWAVVGWGLNCAVCFPGRWERWALWLGFMIEVLKADLESRAAKKPSEDDQNDGNGVAGSLIAKFLASVGEGRNSKRRLMRAIFADGKSKSLAEFGEIWRHETKPPKPKREDEERAAKRRRLDLENGDFGDYFDAESDEDSPITSARRSRSATAVSSRQRSRAASEGSSQADSSSNGDSLSDTETSAMPLEMPSVATFGGMQALQLRQNLLALLVRFSILQPQAFLSTEELFDLFTEFLRPLPLPVFQQFVLPSKAYLSPVDQTNLNQMLLRPLLAATAPAYSSQAPTQEQFENHFAPHAANNSKAVDNAKVSLLVESLLRFLWKEGLLEGSAGLKEAVKRGTEARIEKVGFEWKIRKGSKGRREEEGMAVLQASAGRMEAILDMI